MTPFEEMLAAIGRHPEEPMFLGSQPHGGTGLTPHLTTVAAAPTIVAELRETHNLWWLVQPLIPGATRRRAADIAGVTTLFADLDLAREGKLGGTGAQLAAVTADLADILGTPPAGIIFSGHGTQPLFRCEPMDAVTGIGVLLRWRELVIKVCAEHGVTVDTGVLADLARVIRVPGTLNGKPDLPLVPTSFTPGPPDTRALSRADLEAVLQSYVPGTKKTRGRGGTTGALRNAGTGDEGVFTREQAMDYLLRNPGHLAAVGRTAEGEGFNVTLLQAATDLGEFVSGGLFTDIEAEDLLLEEIEKQFPGGPDAADWATIRSGFGRGTSVRRAPTEVERADPFGPLGSGADLVPRVEMTKQKASRTGFTVPPPPGADDNRPWFLPEEFWDARPVFKHLRSVAHGRRASPEGVMVAAILLTLAHTMPNVMLPACVGVEASANLMGIAMGRAGDGKSVCRKLATKALRFIDVPVVHQFPPGSGQGITAQYQKLSKNILVGGIKVEGMVRIRYSAFATVEESEKIAALTKGQGSTLASELRAAAMGELVGAGNIGETQTNLPENSYRFVLWMCMQPELSGWLLGEGYGGLPQRFLVACVRDHRIVGLPDRGPIAEFPVHLPIEARPGMNDVFGKPGPKPERIMGVPDEVCVEIVTQDEARKTRSDESEEDLSGHAVLLRLKVSAALALLDGRIDMNAEDWHLAGLVQVSSDAAWEWTRGKLAEVRRREADERSTAAGRGAAVARKAEAKAEAGEADQCCDDVLRVLSAAGEGGLTGGKLNSHRAMRAYPKATIQRAVGHLRDEGKISAEKTSTYAGKDVFTLRALS